MFAASECKSESGNLNIIGCVLYGKYSLSILSNFPLVVKNSFH